MCANERARLARPRRRLDGARSNSVQRIDQWVSHRVVRLSERPPSSLHSAELGTKRSQQRDSDESQATLQLLQSSATGPSPRAMSSSPRPGVPPPVRGSSNTVMTLVSTDIETRHFLRPTAFDAVRGEIRDEGYYGNDVGEHTQPASGVVGTSSACYPSHPASFKFS